jgi:hypothetical protein
MINQLMKKSIENASGNECQNHMFVLKDGLEYDKETINAYSGFETKSVSKGNALVDHSKLFGANEFKKITKIDLPKEIEDFFVENPCFFYLQFPVFSQYNYNDWTTFTNDVIHPQRMAKVMTNKWDYITKSYYRRGLHSFVEDKIIPVVHIGDGDYLTYYYGEEKVKGIYFFDEKIADTYIEMIKRLAINPTYYISLKNRIKDKSGFTKNSVIDENLFD